METAHKNLSSSQPGMEPPTAWSLLSDAHQVNLWCEKAGNSFAEGSPELLGRRGGGQVGETLPTLELFCDGFFMVQQET